ncbi:MAG: lysylphosphatidylglycerol synthase transmembrane domain-containing protein [Gammaproteobacteria bacterium]
MFKSLRFSLPPWARWTIRILVVVAYFWVLEYFWGWEQLLKPWLSISYVTILAAIALLASTYFIRALRIYDYFRKEIKREYLLTLKLTLLHNVLNNLLPARSGEVSFPLLMKRYFQVSFTRATASLFWLRFMDLHTVLLLGAMALYFATIQASWWLYAVALWMMAPLAAYLAHTKIAEFIPRIKSPKWQNFATKFVSGLPNSLLELFRAWMWTLINWSIKITAMAWILKQFSPMSNGQAWVGSIAGDLSSVLPFHAPAGLGSYEAAVLGGLAALGIDADTAMQAAVNLHIMILVSSLIGGGLALLMKQGGAIQLYEDSDKPGPIDAE